MDNPEAAESTGKKTILIVDGHPLIREGFKSVIARSAKFQVVGEASDGREGVELVKKLKPDLVVMAVSLPDKNGIGVTRDIRSLSSGTRVIILSKHRKVELITAAFQAGAVGYVLKESAADSLLHGLEMVSRGRHFLDSSVSNNVVKSLTEISEKGATITDTNYQSLTPREQEVMRLVVEGLSAKQIAEKLFISLKTVENHRAHIMHKLNLNNTVDLVRYAARVGLIDVDLWKA